MSPTSHVNDEAQATWRSSASILLVDDEPANLEFLRHVLETEGYGALTTISDPLEAVARLPELDPDVVILDLMMPQMDGFDVMRRIHEMLEPGDYLPILVATADPTPGTRRRALSAGARDFLTKPLSPAEVRLRVRNLMETRFLHLQLKEYSLLLEHRVHERTRELEEARLEMLFRLARAAEFRDDDTGQHTLRVGRVAGRLAEVMGLSAEAAALIRRAAPLHDVGKIGIPDSILLKPGRLTAEELRLMRTHTLIGANILSGGKHPLLRLAEEIALTHHEHWDGGGYPQSLSEREIPLSGRIVAVADVFDSLTHERPYKRAWTQKEALVEIESQAGRQFDPDVVEALLRVAPEAAVLEAEIAPGETMLTAEFVPEQPTVTYTSIDATALAGRVRTLETERDALARELHALRRQVERGERALDRLNRTGQPN